MLCLAWLPLSYSNAQELIPGQQYTTQNVVQQTQQGGPSTWVNGVYQNSLTCWTWGNPGYCGPNAIVRPANNINFSFGQTDLYQTQAVASILPSATGLRVNGYNFSFTAKNGNGWDDGRVDYLYAYTHFTNQNNQVVSYNSYNLNYKFNWTTFNFSETFATPFVANDLKNVTYGFVGRDNNGWAGPYGPEITNVSFSLKYSVDPCVTNPLYSPSCPGYLDALNKLKPISAPEPVAVQTVSVLEPATTTTTTQPTQAQQVSSTPIATVVSTPTVMSTVTATTQTQQATQKSGTPSIGTLLSIITSVQAQNSATERAVVQQATQEAAKQAEKATQDAENVVAKQVQQQQEQQQTQQNLQSTTIQQTFVNTTRQDIFQLPGSNQQRQNIGLPTATATNQESFSQNFSVTTAQPTQTQVQAPGLPNITSTAQEVVLQKPLAIVVQPQQSQAVVQAAQPPAVLETQQTQQATSIYQLVQPATQVISAPSTTTTQNTVAVALITPKPDPLPEINTEQKQVTGPTNILQPFLDQKPTQENVQQTQQTAQVNKSARDSELAGSVTLVAMARQPQGFETYMAILQDVPFYKPTEVYPNQRTVDNQRVQRLLTGASDAKHKELVDSQYRR